MSNETNSLTSPRRPVAAVGVVCLRGHDVLLVRRAKPPRKDGWSLPGGRIEWGETAELAALRELKEETGCDAALIGLIDVVNAIVPGTAADAPPWGHYVLIDYAARWTGGEPVAGDDASQARFFAPEEISALNLWAQTVRVVELARTMAG